MYETFPKGSKQPSSGVGNQRMTEFQEKKNSSKRTYPGAGSPGSAGMANEQHMTLKQGSGMMGSVSCKGKKTFPTEKDKKFVSASKKAAVTKSY